MEKENYDGKENYKLSMGSIISKGQEDYFHCQKCRTEFDILVFEELPVEIQKEFKLILNKTPLNSTPYFFYCQSCNEFSIISATKE